MVKEKGREMKIIFCDIDGVLNSDYFTKKNGGNRSEIEERKVKNLKKIADATGAEVVIVSHANSFYGEEYNQLRINLIKQYGVDPIASLDSGGFLGSKEDVVNKFLREKKVDKFVIIDDAADNYYLLETNLILVKGRNGLTSQHIKEVINRLS